MPWLALTVEIDGRQVEALGDALLATGAQSVSVDALEGSPQKLTALLAAEADPARVLAQAARDSGLPVPPRFALARIEDDDWVRRSQAQFAPLELERLWIGPTWHDAPPRARAVVQLDPGLAFGTGSHPSTRLVLELLEREIAGGERVLDYGCGSGILAIAAAKLGAAVVDAVDLDPQALETAAANARANDVRMRVCLPEALAPACYDLVAANILAQPLVVLAPLLAARVAPGGRLALSGVLASQADEVVRAYAAVFETTLRTHEGWTLIEGRKR